jgi:hypothetical protein
VTAYLAWAGVHEPAPWCASAVGYLHAQAAQELASNEGGVSVNHCPRTPSALHLAERAPSSCRLAAPQPGAVFVLDRGKGRGHCGWVEAVHVDGQPGPLPGQIVTCEPDTNSAGSTTGDAWGRHTWSPTDDHGRGELVGWFDFGVSP